MTGRRLFRCRVLLIIANLGVSFSSFGNSGAREPQGPALAAVGGADHFADADDPSAVRAGRAVYAARCARCHGRRLEGQALWQLQDQFAGRRAPAHDESGHTWQHSDEELWQITRSGRLPRMRADEKSYMPAFAGILSDAEILDVIAYIKARWALGIRISQATLNPGFAGLPAGSDDADWTLPPNCSSTLQSWRAESR